VFSILFFVIHLVDDINRGFEMRGVSELSAIPIFVLWLYETLVLAERRMGYLMILFGLLVPIAHMIGKGLGGVSIAESSGGFFFVFTIIAIGVTAVFTFLLAAQELWSFRRGGPSTEH
jgi:hypothetical protein